MMVMFLLRNKRGSGRREKGKRNLVVVFVFCFYIFPPLFNLMIMITCLCSEHNHLGEGACRRHLIKVKLFVQVKTLASKPDRSRHAHGEQEKSLSKVVL